MKKFIPAILVVLIVIVGGSTFYFYNKTVVLKTNPQEIAQKQTTDLLTAVGKLILLPKGEVPTIATVSDPEKLKDQAFFAKAKKGDQVLLYSTARKAYLYDPVANKILEVAPINLDAPVNTPVKKTETATTTKKK